MKNSTIAIIIVITLIIAMLTTGIIYAFTSSAPQGAEEPKADAAAESNTETESVTDTAAPEEPPETERKIEIINNLSADIPGVDKQEFYGLIKAGAVAEMVQGVKDSGMKVEDIQSIYPQDDLVLYFGVFGYGELGESPNISSLRQINEVLPIEFIRQIDEDHLYVVYKVRARDDAIWYTYVFFERFAKRCNETHESWWRKGNVFYVAKALEYSDFADIHIGSTNAEVHAVDPVVYPGLYPDDYPKEPFKSYHLMKDGVLTITYSFEPEADRPLVSAMDYDDSFTFAPYGKDDDYRMNVRIDPNDLPAPSSSDVEVK